MDASGQSNGVRRHQWTIEKKAICSSWMNILCPCATAPTLTTEWCALHGYSFEPYPLQWGSGCQGWSFLNQIHWVMRTFCTSSQTRNGRITSGHGSSSRRGDFIPPLPIWLASFLNRQVQRPIRKFVLPNLAKLDLTLTITRHQAVSQHYRGIAVVKQKRAANQIH